MYVCIYIYIYNLYKKNFNNLVVAIIWLIDVNYDLYIRYKIYRKRKMTCR